MVFAHDAAEALRAAVTLVNSAAEPDTLTDIEALDEFYAEFEYTGRRDRTAAELAAVRAVRPKLRALLLAERDDAVGIINGILDETPTKPQLVRHEEYDWHLHLVDPQAPLPIRIQSETAMAMVDVIRADEGSRLDVCADDDCDGIVLDLSRNRSRRYCSTACGNRNAVAAYRARQAAD